MAKDTTTTTARPDTTNWTEIGTNLKSFFVDGVLFLAIPVPADRTTLPLTGGTVEKLAKNPTTTKKNVQVASSHGNVPVPGTNGIKLGLNAFAAI